MCCSPTPPGWADAIWSGVFLENPKGWVPIAKLKKIKKDFSDLGATWVS